MAKQVSLKASLRPGVGRLQARKSRAQSMIPAVIYGSHIKPTPIQVGRLEVERIFKHATSENMMVNLDIEEGGKTSNRLAFIQEIQHDPLKDCVLHLDFHEVRADEKLRARVPILSVGEPEGVRTGGGVLEQVLRELEVECLPKDLPDRLMVDVSNLQIGSNIHVNQVQVPEGVTVVSHADVSVFTLLAPVKEEEVAPAAEATEPEVIKQKKEGDEEGDVKEGAAKGKAEAKPAAKGGDAKGGDAKAAKPAKGEKK